jgi:hypothetical protein
MRRGRGLEAVGDRGATVIAAWESKARAKESLYEEPVFNGAALQPLGYRGIKHLGLRPRLVYIAPLALKISSFSHRL